MTEQQKQSVAKGCLKAVAVGFGLIVALAVVGSLIDEPVEPEPSVEPDTPPPSDTAPAAEASPPTPPAWERINFVDEFGEISGRGARSSFASPIRRMSFPYHDIKAWIVVNCDHAWLGFSQTPNLTGGSIESGYSIYYLDIRLDGERARAQGVTQDWGDDVLHFRDDAAVISALARGKTFAVSLPWYGTSAAFRWSLGGSTDAIRWSCSSP